MKIIIEPTCAISAILLLVSNILGFSFFHPPPLDDGEHYTWSDYHKLNTDLIQKEFDARRQDYVRELFAGTLNAVAWMTFCMPILQVAWVQSRQGTYLLGNHVAMAALALGGSITELISRLLFVGTIASSISVADHYNLYRWIPVQNATAAAVAHGASQHQGDFIGWRVLEMIHIVNQGLLTWIDTSEWLFLSAILALMYVSAFKSKVVQFDRNWARLGLLMSVLAFANFAASLLRLQAYSTFNTFGMLLTFVSRVILMPLWLIWLGVQLPKIKLQARAAAVPTQDVESYDPTVEIKPSLDVEASSFA